MPGRNGVVIYSKIEPLNIHTGFNNEQLDKESHLIYREFEKLFLVNVYTRYSGEKLQNLSKRLEWDKCFINFIKNLQTKMSTYLYVVT